MKRRRTELTAAAASLAAGLFLAAGASASRSSRMKRALIAFAIGAVGLLAMAPGAFAVFHETKIREISGETGGSNVSFIELQMYSPGQNQVSGHNVTIWDADAFVLGVNPVATLPLVGPNPAGADNQRTILIGDSAVAGRDFTLDLTPYFDVSTGANVAGAGAACFEAIPVDCVSWGGMAFTGAANLPDKTTPFSSVLTVGALSLQRKITAGCPTLLEASDDTDHAEVDFVNVPYSPTPNSTAPVETPCSTPITAPATTTATTTTKKKCPKGKKLVKVKGKKKCKRKRKKK